MTGSKQDGFTIIEATLYLGVAALLLGSMMAGITLAVQRQRFSDSVNATQGFLQQQFNETQNTINERANGVPCKDAQPGTGGPGTESRGASKCLVVGKILDFGPTAAGSDSTITTHDVLIKSELPEDYATFSGGDLGLFQTELETRAVQNSLNDTVFKVPWGARLPQLNIGDASPPPDSDIRYIALLRSPVSGSTALYYLENFSGDMAAIQAIGGDLKAFSPDQAARVCVNSVELSSAKSLLKIAAVGSQDGVTTHFDNDPERLNWCP